MNNKTAIGVLLALLIVGGWWWTMGSDSMMPADETPMGETTQTSGGAKPTAGSKVPAVKPGEKGVSVVTYTDAGFSPFIKEIQVGTAVRFENKSSYAMWITGYQDPDSSDHLYQELDQGKSIGRGESYTFNFLKKGVWGYKNKNIPEDRGAVVAQ